MVEQGPENLKHVGELLAATAYHLAMLLLLWVDWLFTEYLLLGNIISASLLLGLADLTIQTMEIYIMRKAKHYDRDRNYRSMKVGMILGIFNHLWYAFLETMFLEAGELASVFKKIALDQVVAGPFFSSAFLIGMGLFEGRTLKNIYAEWNQKFLDIYMVDWMFWPLAQFINFYVVPYRYRVFYVNFATFLWNTFLCYAKYKSGTKQQQQQQQLSGHHRLRHGVNIGFHQKNHNSRSPPRKAIRRVADGTSTRSRTKTKRVSPTRPSTKGTQPGKLSSRANRQTLSVSMNKNQHSITSTAAYLRNLLTYVSRASLTHMSLDIDLARSGEVDTLTSLWGSDRAVREPTSSSSASSNSETEGGSDDSNSSTNTANPLAGGKDAKPSTDSWLNILERSSSTDQACIVLPKDSEKASKVKTPTVKRVGLFAKAGTRSKNTAKTTRQLLQLGNGALHQRRQPLRKPPAGSLRATAVNRLPIKPARTTDTPSPAAGDVPKRLWVAPHPGKRLLSGRRASDLQGAADRRLEELSQTVKELQSLWASENSRLSSALADTQSQVTWLHEICAHMYMAMEAGNHDVAEKMETFASWVASERKMSAEDIRPIVEDILAKNNL